MSNKRALWYTIAIAIINFSVEKIWMMKIGHCQMQIFLSPKFPSIHMVVHYTINCTEVNKTVKYIVATYVAIYRIRTNIAKELNLENWQIFARPPNLNLINIFSIPFHS